MASRSKGPGPDPKNQRLSSQRAAEARRRIAEAQRRRRMITVAAAVGAIAVVVAVFVVVKVVSNGNSPKSGTPAMAVGTTVTTDLAGVPATVFDTIGLGDAKAAPKPTSAAPLTLDGKPRVLFVGAEWCPFCAAERWALAVALERFGDLSGLQAVSSSPTDTYPNTPSISFSGATYTSDYLAFTGKEVQSNQVADGKYKTLDTLAPADKALWEKAGAGYPFIDLGGTSLINGAQYDPNVLKGKTQVQVAEALSQPKTTIALGVVGSANLITAKLCTLTGNKPAAVCSSKAVKTATAALPTS